MELFFEEIIISINKEVDKMKVWLNKPKTKYWLSFIGRTLFYFAIFLVLIYLYHYKSIQGGNFIYNEF